VRLDAFPDGGISRIRVLGTPDRSARLAAGLRWFAALPAPQARTCLLAEGVPEDEAERLMAARPYETTTVPEPLRGMLTGER
jgi:allantoicase